jgi:spore coat protein A
MRLTRREFLEKFGLLAAAVIGMGFNLMSPEPERSAPNLNPNLLARFVDRLPIPGIAKPVGLRPDPSNHARQLPYYRVEMRQFEARLHRDVKPTSQWGYDGSVPGPTFETSSGQSLLVEWINRLPQRHFLPIDYRLHGANANAPEVRTVVHLHGAKAPPQSDGYPEDWFISGRSAVTYYPNQQASAMLWYHDHAMGITRLNIFAGLLGAFIIRDATEAALDLPGGEYEIPLIIYDRTLNQSGQLKYPTSGIPGSPWVAELNGNAIVINGKIFPYLDVEPRKYRFRVLNAANFRFFDLSLSNRQPFYQIGTDLGLLPAPVELSRLTIFPAERADLVIDFSARAGQTIELMNLANEILQFRVRPSRARDMSVLPMRLNPITRTAEADAVKTRTLALVESDDSGGNSMVMLLDGKRFHEPVSEKPVIDTVEIWELVNATGDTHPIHLHLVRFQILDRRPFDRFAYNLDKSLRYTGPAVPPAANEAGWKDTVRTEPDAVTRIIIRFEGYTGRYVWHCHLLEHEDNEMMRPYEVVASAAATAADLSTEVELCIDGRIVRKRNLVVQSTDLAGIKDRSR